MIIPHKYNIQIWKGTNAYFYFTFTQSGSAMPLSGYSAYAEVRQTPDSDLILNLSPTVSGNAVIIDVPYTDTAAISANEGVYRWSLILEDSTGERVGPYVIGEATLFDSITQPA